MNTFFFCFFICFCCFVTDSHFYKLPEEFPLTETIDSRKNHNIWYKHSYDLKPLISTDAENLLFAKGILTLNRHSQSNSGLIDDQNNLGMYSKT